MIRNFTVITLLLSAALLCGCQPMPGPTTQPTIDPKTAARQELLNDATNLDPFIRGDAIEALAQVDPPDARQFVIKGLADPDANVRYTCCLAAGTLQFREAMPTLLAMADDKDLRVQAGVRFALHKMGDTHLTHDLEKLAHTSFPDVEQQKGEDTEHMVARQKQLAAQTRACVAQVLGMLGEPSAIGLLHPMLDDQDASVRIQAAEALWRLKDDDGLKTLVGFTISVHPDDQIVALTALAEPRDPRVITNLEGYLPREDQTPDYPEVSLAAARGLAMLGGSTRFEGWKVSLKYAHTGDWRQKHMAALALGAMGRPELGPALNFMLTTDSNIQVRLAAAEALLELHDQPDN